MENKSVKKEFNVKDHIVKLEKSRKRADGTWEKVAIEYLPVAARVAWFRSNYPIEKGWGIRTELEAVAEGKVRMRALVVDPEGKVLATAIRTGSQGSFADYVEKAETGAIGRALALAGYGLASEPDLDEEEALADAPIERKVEKEPMTQAEVYQEKAETARQTRNEWSGDKVTDKQLNMLFAIGKSKFDYGKDEMHQALGARLGLESFSELTKGQASDWIDEWTKVKSTATETEDGRTPF